MGTEIYYFTGTGTGNSLAVARDIALKSNGKLISIVSVMDKVNIKTDADVIGIVFPVHYIFNGGVPHIVERFVENLQNMDKKYIFAVCTHGGVQGDTIKKLDNIIKSCGGKLAAGFAVRMPYNYTWMSGNLLENSIEKQRKMFRKWEKKLEIVIEYENVRKEGKFETNGKIIVILFNYFGMSKFGKSLYQEKAGLTGHADLTFQEILPLMDKNFQCDKKCNVCCICSNICQVNNIKMINNSPVWQNSCVQCFACLQWCPEESILYGNKMSGIKRYHHPEVNINDMLMQKEVIL